VSEQKGMEKFSEQRRAKKVMSIFKHARLHKLEKFVRLVASDADGFSFFLFERDAKAFFSPLRLGEQRIPNLASVKSGLWPSRSDA